MSTGALTITSKWTRHLAEHARSRGLAVDSALDRLAIHDEAVSDPHGRVLFRSHLELSRWLVKRLDDPGVGIDLGATAGTADFGMVGLLAESRPTFRGALETVRRFDAVANEASKMDFWVEGDRLFIQDAHLPDGRPTLAALAEATMAFYVSVIRQTTGVVAPLHEVWLAHGRHSGWSAERRSHFAAPVRFSRPINALVLPAELLDAPLRTARPELSPHLNELAKRLHGELAPRSDGAAGVAREVRRALPRGGPKPLGRVARSLGMATRTLQRHLESRGLSYREVVDEVRREVSATLLSDSDLSMETIAERVGYSDVRAFRRAFHRWFGQPPGAYRRAHR